MISHYNESTRGADASGRIRARVRMQLRTRARILLDHKITT